MTGGSETAWSAVDIRLNNPRVRAYLREINGALFDALGKVSDNDYLTALLLFTGIELSSANYDNPNMNRLDVPDEELLRIIRFGWSLSDQRYVEQVDPPGSTVQKIV